MNPILIVPVLPCRSSLTESLVDPLGARFHAAVAIDTAHAIDPTFSFDAYRNQHNSTALIGHLVEQYGLHAGKVIGLTEADLYIPVLTFVFGEAQLDGLASVVSAHRLEETFYGLPANAELTEERLVKEAVHELGHTYGLVHCPDYTCVMHSSTGVDEIDVKGSDFCPACRGRLESNKETTVPGAAN